MSEHPQIVRKEAVAGMFYPADPKKLRQQVNEFLEIAPVNLPIPKALIAPHAGFIYSGPIAATAYAAVRPLADKINRVVLLGPAHRVYLRGIAASSADAFHTPVGNILLDRETTKHLVQEFPFVQYNDEAHHSEHCLEVHLPFLIEVLNQFDLIPLVVGDAQADMVKSVLDFLWGDDDTLVIVSSDLSHYHDYETAVDLDTKTSRFIEQLDGDKIHSDSACGRTPVAGLLQKAKQLGLCCTTVDQRNSGDTAGPRDSVVGYGSYLIYRQSDSSPEFEENHRQILLNAAHQSILQGLEKGTPLALNPEEFSAELRQQRGVFVTLKLNGQLRGCIGNLTPKRSLIEDTASSAYAAAFKDPRFEPLSKQEMDNIKIGISVLSTPSPIDFDSESSLIDQLVPGEDGLILREGSNSGTFLPSVWEQLPEPREFLFQLKHKAGLPTDYWSETIEVLRYQTESW
ncbi:AmmeMemoRadiSam system protein B [Pseudomonadota bacterium]